MEATAKFDGRSTPKAFALIAAVTAALVFGGLGGYTLRGAPAQAPISSATPYASTQEGSTEPIRALRGGH